MVQFLRNAPRLKSALATGVGIALIGGFVTAQTVTPPPIAWDERRLERLDRNVRKLERALNQRNAAGDPVIIAPDPEVVALMGRADLMDQRVADLEATLIRLNGQVEDTVGVAERAARENAELSEQIAALTARIAALEASAAEAEAAAPPDPQSPTGEPEGDYAAAMQLMLNGDYAGARRAFETFIVTWPEADQFQEANYRLAETRLIAEDDAGAAQAYAVALRGWPRTAWAADATVKLAGVLLATDRRPQACQALSEFANRYAQGASPAVRQRAQTLASRARCGA